MHALIYDLAFSKKGLWPFGRLYQADDQLNFLQDAKYYALESKAL